jgi:RNA polymerase sigma factor (sigma-70 family)
MAYEEDDAYFRILLQRVKEGSEEAAWELVNRYGGAIRRAVRRALHHRLRSGFDSIDFVQLVWSSFFRTTERLERFESPEELAGYLAAMARNKVVMEARRSLQASKRDLNRAQSLFDSCGRITDEVHDREPAPIQVAMAREQWELLMQDQPPLYRQIIQLRMQGCTHREIAHALKIGESTVRRFLKRLLEESPP